MTEFLSLKNVTKIYKKKEGIKAVNLEIRQGELVGIIGANGVGKTTLMKLIFNELSLDEGEIWFKGTNLQKIGVPSSFAFFTNASDLPKDFTIQQFCDYSASLKGLHINQVRVKFETYLALLNLQGLQHKKISDLSSGMQKKVLLISILMYEPDILFFDEPTENMDINTRIEFINILKYLSDNEHKTIVITSHNIDELNNIINKVVILEKINGFGTVIYHDTFDCDKQNLQELYIQKTNPQQSQLLASLQVAETPVLLQNIKKSSPIHNSIFQWSLKSIVKNKSFIICSILFFLCFMILGALLISRSTTLQYDAWLNVNFWILIAVVIAYIGFYNLKFIPQLFSLEHNQQIYDLEKRSGNSANKIIAYRLLATKLPIWLMLCIFIIAFVIIGACARSTLVRAAAFNLAPGLLFFYVLELLFSSTILILLNLFKKSTMAIATNTLLLILFILSFFIGFLISLAQTDISMRSSPSHNQMELKLLYEINQSEMEYQSDSLIRLHMNSIWELNDLVHADDPDQLIISEYGKMLLENAINSHEYNPENSLFDYAQTIDMYVDSLLKSGLISEIKHLAVYQIPDIVYDSDSNSAHLNSSWTPVTLAINEEIYTHNPLIQFFEKNKQAQMLSDDQLQINQDFSESLFIKYNQMHSNKQLIKYHNMNGFHNFIKTIANNDSQWKALSDIVRNALIYDYQPYTIYGSLSQNWSPIASNLEKYSFNDEVESQERWLYLSNMHDFNQQLFDLLLIADGARTFNKIYTDLLFAYYNMQNITFVDSQYPETPISFDDYLSAMRIRTYLNPFASLTNIFMTAGFNDNIKQINQGFLGYHLNNHAYAVQNHHISAYFNSENKYEKKIMIDTQKNTFSSINSDESIDASALLSLIAKQMTVPFNPQNLHLSIASTTYQSYTFKTGDSVISKTGWEFYLYDQSELSSSLPGFTKLILLFNQNAANNQLNTQNLETAFSSQPISEIIKLRPDRGMLIRQSKVIFSATWASLLWILTSISLFCANYWWITYKIKHK